MEMGDEQDDIRLPSHHPALGTKPELRIALKLLNLCQNPKKSLQDPPGTAETKS